MSETTLNPDFDRAKYVRQMKNMQPADRSYLIVFTPRSGSTWLTTVLMSTGVHGQPREYINEEIRAEMARRLNAFDHPSLLEMLKRKRKSANGVFGIRATSTHIRAFGEDAFFDGLGADTLVYMLWREDIVAQGLSAYRAVETQKFHSYQNLPTGVPPYDARKIRMWVSHILEIENANCAMLARRGVTPHIVCYEDIVRDRDAAIARFAAVQPGATPSDRPDDPASGDLTKVGDAWNEEAEARFRAREKAFVTQVESRRSIKSIVAPAP